MLHLQLKVSHQHRKISSGRDDTKIVLAAQLGYNMGETKGIDNYDRL
jgi:hypothetical protein